MDKSKFQNTTELCKKYAPKILRNPFMQEIINEYAEKVKEGKVKTDEDLTDRDLEDLSGKDFEGCP